MFFADKIILVEGLCERLLMPLFTEKIDKVINENLEYKNIRPLSEQYISVIEIGGAYMNKFKEFLEFLNIKTLIITDVDCCQKKECIRKGSIIYLKDGVTPKMSNQTSEVKKEFIDNLVTTNSTLIQWMPKKYKISDLIFHKFNINDINTICVTFQKNHFPSKTDIKCGRSFEEAFIIDNTDYILEYKKELSSIKNNIDKYETTDDIFKDSYIIYSYIDVNKKKSNFAFDLMYVHQERWHTPAYIKEGLLWLAK